MSPKRAPRVCAHPGCPELVTGGPRCEDHTVERYKDPAQARFYGSARWKTLRARVRKEEPMCRTCGKRRSTSVDHINGDWRDNRRENLRALCTPCEKSRTGRQHASRRGGGSIIDATGPSTAPKSQTRGRKMGTRKWVIG